MIDVATRERDRYLTRVAARLQGLGASEREELLEDLREHLAEVEAEAEGDLEALLGPPDRYADELLASAGLERTGRRRRLRPWLRAVAERDLARLEPLRHHPEVVASIAGLRQARPAWWVFRGWATVVMSVAIWGVGSQGVPRVVPHVGGSRALGLLAITTGALASVWLGRRTDQRWAHRLSVAANVLMALLLLLTASSLSTAASRLASAEMMVANWTGYASWWPPGSLGTADGQIITNLYPFDADGRPLERVRLYDQDGRPVQIAIDETGDGLPVITSFEIDAAGQPVPNAFPQRQVPRFAGDRPSSGPGPSVGPLEPGRSAASDGATEDRDPAADAPDAGSTDDAEAPPTDDAEVPPADDAEVPPADGPGTASPADDEAGAATGEG